MNEAEHVVGDVDRGTRKRKKNITSKQRRTEIRYSDPDLELQNFDLKCQHKIEKFKCKELSLFDVKSLKHNFYSEKNKNAQDEKLAKMMEVKNTQRKRSRKNGKSHDFHIEYYVWNKNKRVPVCQKLFLSIFNCGQTRLHNIAKKKMAGTDIKDRRGGDMRSKKYASKRANVTKFIESLKGQESHYNRSKSRRIYLSSELNIKKLWNLYNAQVEDKLQQVNYKYFSRVFNNKFNIAFGTPATDVCGFCIRTKTEIENCKEASKKTKLKTDLLLHQSRAKQFFKLMKEEPSDTVTYCFDLEQVQVLPKAPIQEAFYAQQLSLYAFCITDISMKNPVFYTWLEHEAGRGVTEISSALTDFLSKVGFDPEIKELRLFCDGCGGQNKNSHLVHALMLWLFNYAPKSFKKITCTFPVRGHSFMAADRVFGQIEVELRAHAFIKTPEKYYEIYAKKGHVRKLGIDWKLLDIKKALQWLKKIPGISETKRIKIIRKPQTGEDKILVKTEILYRNDDATKQFSSLLKAKKLSQVHLPTVPLHHEIKKKKIDSPTKFLISLSGNNWVEDPELKWLDPVLRNQSQHKPNDDNKNCDECQDEEGCCCLEDETINIL